MNSLYDFIVYTICTYTCENAKMLTKLISIEYADDNCTNGFDFFD